MWSIQIASLDRHLSVIAAGGYQPTQQASPIDEMRNEIASVIDSAGTTGATVSDISNELCLTEACVRHHVNVMTGAGAITMLSTSPRRYVSNEWSDQAMADVKAAAQAKREAGMDRGVEAMRAVRAKNVENVMSAIRRARTISTTQLMEAANLRHEGLRMILKELREANKVKRKRGARGMYWWSLK